MQLRLILENDRRIQIPDAELAKSVGKCHTMY